MVRRVASRAATSIVVRERRRRAARARYGSATPPPGACECLLPGHVPLRLNERESLRRRDRRVRRCCASTRSRRRRRPGGHRRHVDAERRGRAPRRSSRRGCGAQRRRGAHDRRSFAPRRAAAGRLGARRDARRRRHRHDRERRGGTARGDGADVAPGPVVPAMPNLHSHAFQRALAGRTGRASGGHDDTFWTWRQAMYAFLDRIDADAFEAIAAQAYVEMAKAGYATVAEFHYVHHDPPASRTRIRPSSRGASARRRDAAGSGLTLLPVFYAHGGFGGAPTTASQRRFVHSTLTYLAPARAPGGEAAERGYRARRRAAQPARRHARRSWARSCDWRRRTRRSTSTPPSRRARSTTASRGAGCGRSSGC